MNNIDKLTKELESLVDVLKDELVKAIKGNKAAARRARKATIDLAKVGKDYRAESIKVIG